MDYNLNKVKEILSKYNQNHLLRFYDELTDDKKLKLLNQILNIDFKNILNLYDKSMEDEKLSYDDISPLSHLEKDNFSYSEIDFFTKIGEEKIKNNSLAVVTMAGGQGTRLGYKGPKGTYALNLKHKKKSLFEIICDDIKKANEKFNIVIPWYIMTSLENDKQTKDYFYEHNFFDYPKEKINFFTQGKLPLISIDKKLILQETYLIKEASNGNGNVFNSMQKHGIIDELESNSIEWISFGGIDNILLKNIDPFFLGLAINKNFSIASKSIFKKNPMDKVAVYCKKKEKPSILDYNYITLELSNKKDENNMFLYREANMLSHLMHITAVKKVANISLPYHRAFKKNAFVNEEGMKQVPDNPNSYKFENFIFDAFSFFQDMLLLRVNENDEFAPIKSFNGLYTPETAKEKYEKYYNIN